MALQHNFVLLSSVEARRLAIYQRQYLSEGNLIRYQDFNSVPKPIDSSADNAAGQILMDYFKENREKSIDIDDAIIEKNLSLFLSVETFFTGFIPCFGLNYYGFTLIPFESIPKFVEALNPQSNGYEFEKLVELCIGAYHEQSHILHCGI